ncbi:MAG: type II toxin-antitoxin system VapC family toxin [Phycisphaerae bacterium]|nr:type II toxin-antitoxin system VapC family toxin [Phycisphaerae bacterium]
MAKKRVYVESSVISYLTARPARDELNKIRQRLTALWWERRHEWECVVSPTVMAEIARGDPEAAARRREKALSLTEVPVSSEADMLVDLLVLHKLVPESVRTDAVHLAMAAVHGMHYLLTWNQKHLDNLDLRSRIEELIRKHGWEPAKVITPERLLLEESP